MTIPAIGAIAQLGERLHGMQEVGGSIPPGSTNLSFENKGNLFFGPNAKLQFDCGVTTLSYKKLIANDSTSGSDKRIIASE